MNFRFDLDKIQKVLFDFYTVTHIQAAIFNTNYESQLAYPPVCNKVCQKIGTCEQGLLRCDKSGNAGLQACQDSGEPFYMWRCHAGFWECGLPIYVQSELAGFIIFGQFIDGSEGEKENILCRCGDLLGHEELKAMLDEMKAFDIDFIKAAARLMVRSVHSILLEDAFQIREDPIWMRIDQYINDNLGKPLRLESIATDNYISTSTVSHKVKKVTGKSVGELIENRRMTTARKYLMSTDYKVNEIALLVGFPNYNYFSRVFRKTYGYSPNQYRKFVLFTSDYQLYRKEL